MFDSVAAARECCKFIKFRGLKINIYTLAFIESFSQVLVMLGSSSLARM